MTAKHVLNHTVRKSNTRSPTVSHIDTYMVPAEGQLKIAPQPKPCIKVCLTNSNERMGPGPVVLELCHLYPCPCPSQLVEQICTTQ